MKTWLKWGLIGLGIGMSLILMFLGLSLASLILIILILSYIIFKIIKSTQKIYLKILSSLGIIILFLPLITLDFFSSLSAYRYGLGEGLGFGLVALFSITVPIGSLLLIISLIIYLIQRSKMKKSSQINSKPQ